MSARRLLPGLVLALAALPAAPALATVPPGAAGATPATGLAKPSGRVHGDLIRSRPLRGAAALEAAASNRLVRYRSTGSDGRPITVSGTVSVPRGKAPKGGWPVISWAHGTTGIADDCAPSRDSASSPAHAYTAYAYPALNRYLRAGYAVVRTDYQGLGTRGTHEFLVGRTEGRSVLDMVRAARELVPRIGRRVALVGHSQGGHAVLFAAAMAKRWTPELRVRGTVAFAPVSHLSEQARLLPLLTAPSGLSAYVALILRGIDTARPGLHLSRLLSPRAAALYPQTLSLCQAQLSGPDSFGALAPAEVVAPGADLSPLVRALAASADPEALRIRTPVRVEQGTGDATVFPIFTDQLVAEYRKRGNRVSLVRYPGVSHGGILDAANTNALAFLARRF